MRRGTKARWVKGATPGHVPQTYVGVAGKSPAVRTRRAGVAGDLIHTFDLTFRKSPAQFLHPRAGDPGAVQLNGFQIL
jgi:hypothetical protein